MIGNGRAHHHCGKPQEHSVHENGDFWCDGVPVLGPFVELTIRVPLFDYLALNDCTHAEALDAILEELGAFTWDERDENGTRTVLRLRQGGEDRVYPLVVEHGPTGGRCLVVKK
jgi:hypothetical protein